METDEIETIQKETIKVSFFNKIFKEPTDNLFIQAFRYLFSGGVAFVVDFGILFLLNKVFDVYYLYSSIISFIFGLIITYLLSVFWIFNERKIDNRVYEFLIFGVIGGIGLVLTTFFMWLFTDTCHFDPLLSKVFSTIIVTIWNFIAKKYILFTKKENNNSHQ